MMWLYLMAVVIIGVIVVVLVGAWGGADAPAEESPAQAGDDIDELLQRVEPGALTARHLEEIRFDSAVRGYRMDQVDKLIDALAAQLRKTPDGDDIRSE